MPRGDGGAGAHPDGGRHRDAGGRYGLIRDMTARPRRLKQGPGGMCAPGPACDTSAGTTAIYRLTSTSMSAVALMRPLSHKNIVPLVCF